MNGFGLLLAADTMVSGDWVKTFVVAVISAVFAGATSLVVGLTKGRKKGQEDEQKKQERHVTLKEPVAEVPVRKVPMPPTWDQHDALMKRVEVVERDVRDLRNDQAKQYKDLLDSGTERERRLTDKLDTLMRELHGRLDEIFKPKK